MKSIKLFQIAEQLNILDDENYAKQTNFCLLEYLFLENCFKSEKLSNRSFKSRTALSGPLWKKVIKKVYGRR